MTRSDTTRASPWISTTHDGGVRRVEDATLLICDRSEDFLVAVAMGTEAARLPAGLGCCATDKRALRSNVWLLWAPQSSHT